MPPSRRCSTSPSQASPAGRPAGNRTLKPSGASARLLMLIGKGTGQTGAGYDIKPDWESNRTIAQTLTNRLNLQSEGICRPVSLKSGRSLAIPQEVGSAFDVISEADALAIIG